MIEQSQNSDYTTNEWDTLLNEFTNESLTESETVFTFGSCELILGEQDLLKKPADCRTYLLDDSEYRLFYIAFKKVLPEEGKARENEAHLLLYRVGEEKPVMDMSQSPCYGEIIFDFSSESNKLKAGHYFIQISHILPEKDNGLFDTTGNHIRIPFTILPNGRTLSHPTIEEAGVRLHPLEETTGADYTSGEITVTFRQDRTLEEMEEYTLSCYNQSLFLMGKGCITENASPARQRNMTCRITSPYCWMPDNYFCLIEHNGEPFYKIGFKIMESGVDITSKELVGDHTPDFILARFLEKERSVSPYWIRIRETPGFTSFKQRLLEYCRYNKVDRLREQFGLPPIEQDTHYLYVGNEEAATQQILQDFTGILYPSYRFKYVDASQLTELKNTADPFEETTNLLADCERSMICITRLQALISGNGNIVIQRIEKELQSRKEWSLCLIGTEAELSLLFETHPGLKHFFDEKNKLMPDHYRAKEIVHCLQKKLSKQALTFSSEAEKAMTSGFIHLERKGLLRQWNEQYIDDFIYKEILPSYRRRIVENISSHKEHIDSYLSTLEIEDLKWEKISQDENAFEESMKQLNEMVGLKLIKQSLTTTFNKVKFSQIRRNMGFPAYEDECHHMIFTGNPGTGKTTVAKMIGKIFHSMGILSKGDVIVTERSRIVGRYIGETEKNMQSLLAQARGNVLFIDEAYTLCDTSEDRKDFGYRVIESLLTVLAQKNPDILVILAGYEKEMERMMQTNQGLKGRFPYTFHFEDYSTEELIQIARNLLEKEEYELSDAAEKRLRETITETVGLKIPYFSNARWAEKYVSNGIIPAMADRLLGSGSALNRTAYRLIEADDIEVAYQKCRLHILSSPGRQTKIGFRA